METIREAMHSVFLYHAIKVNSQVFRHMRQYLMTSKWHEKSSESDTQQQCFWQNMIGLEMFWNTVLSVDKL